MCQQKSDETNLYKEMYIGILRTVLLKLRTEHFAIVIGFPY